MGEVLALFKFENEMEVPDRLFHNFGAWRSEILTVVRRISKL